MIDLRGDWQEIIVGMVVTYPHCTPTQVFKALGARFPEDELPSLSTLGRWIAQWQEDNASVFLAWKNPDAWKNQHLSAFGSISMGIERLYQRLEADSTPADVMLKDGRYCLMAVIDVYSRTAKILVSKTSKGTAFSLLLRQWILEKGVPESIKTDNGKDYVSHHVTRCLEELEIKQEFCPPFQPWHKGHIERFFRTFSHDLLELDPDYIGHNVSDRQQLRSSKAFSERLFKRGEVVAVEKTAEELQAFCDDWCEAYAHRAHSQLDGKSPFEMVANWRQPIRTVANPRQLDLLLAEAPGRNGVYKVGKQGLIIQGIDYIADVLGAHIGDQVKVRLDPQDLGLIYVYSLSSDFICVAKNPERAGISRKEVAIAARTVQQRRIAEGRAELKRIKKSAKLENVAAEILQTQIEQSRKLLPFPAATEEHETPMLAATEAAIAAEGPRAPIPERTPEQLQATAEKLAAYEQQAQAKADPDAEKIRYLEQAAVAYLAGDFSTLDVETLQRVYRYSDTRDGAARAGLFLDASSPQDAKSKCRAFREAIAAYLAEPHLKAI